MSLMEEFSGKLSITTWKLEKKKKKKKITNKCWVLRVQYKQAIVEALEMSNPQTHRRQRREETGHSLRKCLLLKIRQRDRTPQRIQEREKYTERIGVGLC